MHDSCGLAKNTQFTKISYVKTLNEDRYTDADDNKNPLPKKGMGEQLKLWASYALWHLGINIGSLKPSLYLD